MAAEITTQTYTPVTAADFDLDRVPEHLKVTFAVFDEKGKRVAAGKRSAPCRPASSPLPANRSREWSRPPRQPQRAGLTTWDFDALDRVRDTRHGGNTIRAYPALVDEGSSVSIRLFGTPHDQAVAHRAGVRRLLLKAIPSPDRVRAGAPHHPGEAGARPEPVPHDCRTLR